MVWISRGRALAAGFERAGMCCSAAGAKHSRTRTHTRARARMHTHAAAVSIVGYGVLYYGSRILTPRCTSVYGKLSVLDKRDWDVR